MNFNKLGTFHFPVQVKQAAGRVGRESIKSILIAIVLIPIYFPIGSDEVEVD